MKMECQVFIYDLDTIAYPRNIEMRNHFTSYNITDIRQDYVINSLLQLKSYNPNPQICTHSRVFKL